MDERGAAGQLGLTCVMCLLQYLLSVSLLFDMVDRGVCLC